jgi:hypothetical protein
MHGAISATALEHGLIVATRNVSDFEPTGVPLFNPSVAGRLRSPKQRIWRAQALDRCAPYSPLERRAAPWGSRGRGHKSDKAPGRGRRTLGSFRETKGDPTSGGVRLAHGQADRFIIEAVGVKRLWRASISYS